MTIHVIQANQTFIVPGSDPNDGTGLNDGDSYIFTANPAPDSVADSELKFTGSDPRTIGSLTVDGGGGDPNDMVARVLTPATQFGALTVQDGIQMNGSTLDLDTFGGIRVLGESLLDNNTTAVFENDHNDSFVLNGAMTLGSNGANSMDVSEMTFLDGTVHMTGASDTADVGISQGVGFDVACGTLRLMDGSNVQSGFFNLGQGEIDVFKTAGVTQADFDTMTHVLSLKDSGGNVIDALTMVGNTDNLAVTTGSNFRGDFIAITNNASGSTLPFTVV